MLLKCVDSFTPFFFPPIICKFLCYDGYTIVVKDATLRIVQSLWCKMHTNPPIIGVICDSFISSTLRYTRCRCTLFENRWLRVSVDFVLSVRCSFVLFCDVFYKSSFRHQHTKCTGEWVTVLHRIWEVSGSNLSSETGYSDKYLWLFDGISKQIWDSTLT
jgi:hypothetical protein